MQDSDNDESSFTDTEPVIEVESTVDDEKLEPFSAIHSLPPSKSSKKRAKKDSDESENENDESTNNKPRLRSMPRSLRVVMKNHDESKLSRKKITKLIQERYNIGKATEKRMKRFDKCLSRALDKGLNDIKDIKLSKKSGRYSLILHPSDTSDATTQPKSKTTAPIISLSSVSIPGLSSAPAVMETGPKFTHKWQYDDNGFHDYDKDASKEVEAAYQDYLKSPGCWDVRSVKSGKWEYQVDFPNMNQTNIQHEKHTQRSIRRVNIF